MACTAEAHEALKRDPIAWAQLEYVGLQTIPGEDREAIELRNCPCRSTLARTVELDARAFLGSIAKELHRAQEAAATQPTLAESYGWLDGHVTALAAHLERLSGTTHKKKAP